MKAVSRGLWIILFLIFFSINLLGNLNQNIFLFKGKVITIVDGRGIAINGEKIKNFPRWLFAPAFDYSTGKIYGNAFNGVNYLGLACFDVNKKKFFIVDLTSAGSPSNYIQNIYVGKNFVLLKILNSYYSWELKTGRLSKANSLMSALDVYDSYDNNIWVLTRRHTISLYDGKKLLPLLNVPPGIEKVYWIDKDRVFCGNHHSLFVFDRENKKLLSKVERLIGSKKVLKTLSNYYVQVGNDKLLFYDNNKDIIFDISMLEVYPLSCDVNSGTLLVLKGNEIVKVAPQENSIDNFQVMFYDYYVEIIPTLEPQKGKFLLGYIPDNDVEKLGIITKGNKIRIGSKQRLKGLSIYCFDKNLNVYKGGVGALKNFINYVNLEPYVKYFMLFWALLSITCFIKKRYAFFPVLLLVPLFAWGFTVILYPFRILFVGVTEYSMYVILLQVLFFFLCNIFERHYYINENPMYFRVFSHGSAGTNNLIRLFRLSSVANLQGDIESLFVSARDLFLETTYFEIEKLLNSLSCSAKWIGNLVKIDFLRGRIKKQLVRQKKGRNINYRSLRKRVRKLLEEIEKLKKVYSERMRVNISQITELVLAVHEKTFREKKIAFEKKIEKDLWAIVDRKEFSKIVDNLLMNSIQAVQENPEPHISLSLLRKNTDRIELVVRDNGKGIESEDREKIFLPSFSTKERGGLGLFEIRKILEKYLGSIIYERKNENTFFKVLIRGNL